MSDKLPRSVAEVIRRCHTSDWNKRLGTLSGVQSCDWL